MSMGREMRRERDSAAPPSTPARRLRGLLERPEALLLVGCADALTARIAVESGFEAIYATGAGIANTQLGVPDIGLLTATEMLQQVERITAAVDVPVIADIDTGYGNALNAARAVRAFERAGVGGIQIEDQVFPKQCGHFEGTEVVPLSEMLGKLAAVLDARRDPDLLVIARTDALASLGEAEAIERGAAYAEAGADVVFVEAPRTLDQLERLPAAISAPLLINVVEGGRSPQLDLAAYGAMGYRIVLYANTALRAAASATRDTFEALRRDGTSAALTERILSWDDRQRLVGLPEYRRLAARYAGDDTSDSRPQEETQ
jgi:2-methylisocitrate lyase-like PEP mutase family enzyme